VALKDGTVSGRTHRILRGDFGGLPGLAVEMRGHSYQASDADVKRVGASSLSRVQKSLSHALK
jgi:hypothetical protein